MSETKISKAETEGVSPELRSALLIVGGVKAATSIAQAIQSETIRAVQRVRDQKLFIPLGFQRFDDFLDKSPDAPFNHNKFKQMENALKAEGDELFDFLNSIEAPLSKRKLLGKGDVQIENKEMVARVGNEEIRVPLTNTHRILTVMSRVVEQRNEQARTIERGKKQIDSYKKKLAEANNRPGNGPHESSFFGALLAVCGAFALLATEAEKLTPEERAQQRTAVFKTIGEQMHRLDEALGLEVPESVRKPGKGLPLSEEMLKALDEED